MIFKLLTISIFLSILYSCDCETKVTGKVLDKDTGQPIADAKVDLLNGAALGKTNGNGIFQVVKVTGFCKDPLLKVSSTGYKPFQIEIKKSKGSTQYIIKTESTWIDYNQPFYPDTNNRNTFIKGIWID